MLASYKNKLTSESGSRNFQPPSSKNASGSSTMTFMMRVQFNDCTPSLNRMSHELKRKKPDVTRTVTKTTECHTNCNENNLSLTATWIYDKSLEAQLIVGPIVGDLDLNWTGLGVILTLGVYVCGTLKLDAGGDTEINWTHLTEASLTHLNRQTTGITRMHSSRMRTARADHWWGVYLGDVPAGGVPGKCICPGAYLPGGSVATQGGVYQPRYTRCEQNDTQVRKYYLAPDFISGQ